MAWLFIKKGSMAKYKGRSVKITETLGTKADIRFVGTKETMIVDIQDLENIKPKPRVID